MGNFPAKGMSEYYSCHCLRCNEDGHDGLLQFWFCFSQLDEEVCDEGHMTKAVRRTTTIQLVSLGTKIIFVSILPRQDSYLPRLSA